MMQGAERGYIDDVIMPQASAAREDGGDAGKQAR